MLAVRRNGMGSSKPPDLDMSNPFGYEFGTDTNFPFPSPTEPAPGPPLLHDNEHKYLDNFFSDVDSNHLDFDFFMNAGDSFMNPGWQELPPTFMGTTSSFGQQPAQSQQRQRPATSSTQEMSYKAQDHNAQDMSYKAQDISFNDMNGHRHSHMGMVDGLPSTTSPDVVLAAATLLNNGQNGQSHSMSSEAMFGMTRDNIATSNGQNMHPSLFTSRSRPISGQRPSGHEPAVPDTFYAGLVFGDNAPAGITAADDILRPKKSSKVDIRWGSDSGFGNDQGFVPPPDQETIEEVEREHLQRMKALTPIHPPEMMSSNDSTRPSTPQRKKSLGRIKIDEEDARARKRRKSKYTETDEDETPPTSATLRQAGKKRKSVGKPSSPAPTESSKRKKATAASNAAAAKAARENLTEDQKRENHIKSEQKRRTLIREGFEDLGELVPGLRGGGFSKSAVLVMAADWLDDLIKGNKELKGRVEELERGG